MGKFDEVVGMCCVYVLFVVCILLVALQECANGCVVIEEVIEEVGFVEMLYVEWFIVVLGVIVKVSILFGLYGIVFGMI